MNIVHRLSTGLVSLVMTLGLPALGLAAALVLWPGQAEAFNVHCGTNGVMVGISGRQGWWMDRVTPRCRNINSDGTLSSTVSSGGSAGGNGGTAKGPFTCPQNHVVVGITGSASTSGTRRVLFVHELICLPWVPETRTPLQGTTVTRAAFPRTNPIGVSGKFLAHSCQPGQVATGLSGSAGSYINSITGIGCRLAPGATAPARVPRPASRPSTVPTGGGSTQPAPGAGSTVVPGATGPATGATTSPAGQPDLMPVWGSIPLRHIAPKRKLNTSFCSGMQAQASQSSSRMITVPDVRWGVVNAGSADVATSFSVQLLADGQVLQQHTVNGLRAGESRYFTYRRPRSQTEVARLALVPSQSSRQIYNATGGECVQVYRHPPPRTTKASLEAYQRDLELYEWQDPAFRVVVDPSGAVANDQDRSNNTRDF
jgi:hypothetical protein